MTEPESTPEHGSTPWGAVVKELQRLVDADERMQGLGERVVVRGTEGFLRYTAGWSATSSMVEVRTPRWWVPPKKSRARQLHAVMAAALAGLLAPR